MNEGNMRGPLWDPRARGLSPTYSWFPLHFQSPDLSGHLLQGNTSAESKVAEVQKRHAQALILKVVDLFLTRQVPQRHHIVHELMLSLRGRRMDRKRGVGRFLLGCQQTLISYLWAPCGEGRDKHFPKKTKIHILPLQEAKTMADITNQS